MNLAEFGMNVVENLVAAFPQLMVVGSTLVYSLKKIRTKTEEFPTILKSTKENLDVSFNNAKTDMKAIVEKTADVIGEKVNASLDGMQNELNTYKAMLEQNKDQTNALVKENKLFIDVILQFVAENPKLISDGITQVISLKSQLTKDELEQYPQVLINDLDKLSLALQEVKKVSGEQELDKLLVGLGYERQKL
jgi:hypothetical protein